MKMSESLIHQHILTKSRSQVHVYIKVDMVIVEWVSRRLQELECHINPLDIITQGVCRASLLNLCVCQDELVLGLTNYFSIA